MSLNYDLFVIGAGSGGLAAAERAAAYGARVAIAEHAGVGGACINYGCIPEKLLDYAAGFKHLNEAAVSYGWDAIEHHFNWSQFITAKDQHTHQLNELHRQKLESSNIKIIQGHAAFLDAHTLTVGDRPVTADKILIAVGAKPTKPEFDGIEHTITWHELYHLPKQPKHIAIIGSDPIGVKIAGSMNELGTQITLITPEERVLPGLDAEMAQVIQDQMTQQGVKVLNHTKVEKIAKIDDRYSIELSGKFSDRVTVDAVLVDARRVPNLANLNLNKVGIQLTASGAIRVDLYSRTTQTNIFAIGDCTERIPLTPSAIAQGRAFADTEFGEHPRTVNLDWVPMSLSSHPEAATVGLSETQAQAQFGDAVRCYYSEFRPLLYCLSQGQRKAWMKLVVNQQDSERLLGIHMVGDGAVEIIQSLAIALKLGATKHDLETTIGIHPSTAEELFSI